MFGLPLRSSWLSATLIASFVALCPSKLLMLNCVVVTETFSLGESAFMRCGSSDDSGKRLGA